MHNNSNMRNKQMVINTCKVLPFSRIPWTHACKMTPFFDWKNTPFFAKMGTSVVYVLVRRRAEQGAVPVH